MLPPINDEKKKKEVGREEQATKKTLQTLHRHGSRANTHVMFAVMKLGSHKVTEIYGA